MPKKEIEHAAAGRKSTYEISADPLVSVIINVHNGDGFIAAAIESVLSQTYRNFELLIYDNRSTDGTAQIAGTAARRDKRVRLLSPTKKLKLYHARNLALSEALGEFIAFVDSDDSWYPEKLDTAVGKLIEANADVFYSNFHINDVRTNDRWVAYHTPLPNGRVLDKLALNYCVALSTLVIRKSCLYENSIFFNENFDTIGDFDLVLRLAIDCDFTSSRTPLVEIRRHENNLSTLDAHNRVGEIAVWERSWPSLKPRALRDFKRAKATLLIDAFSHLGKNSFKRLIELFRASGPGLLPQVAMSKFARYVANKWKARLHNLTPPKWL